MTDAPHRDNYSPPQFRVGHLLIVTSAVAIVSAFGSQFGFQAVFHSAIGLCVLWAVIGVIRLVRSANKTRDS